MREVRSIAVLRPAGLGDFIMSTPAFVRLRRAFPGARITLVTLHSQDVAQAAKVRVYAGGERVASWIELIRPHALDDVCVLAPIRNWRSLLEARRAMAKVRPDLIVQMFDPGTPYRRRALKMAFMAALCGPVRQIGWRQPGQIHPGRPPAIDPRLGHHVLGPLQFLREMEERPVLPGENVVFDVRPGNEAEEWSRQWVVAEGIGSRRLVAIAPGAIHDHKQWPLELFGKLLHNLAEHRDDLEFIVMGSPKDDELGQALAASLPGRVRNLCGRSSIAQSAAIFQRCALVVGNDGGAMHLADAMGARVVSIVPGLEFPSSIEPWHNQDRAIRHPVPCAPCYSFTFCPQGHRRCMMDLPLSAVQAQCERALDDHGNKASDQ